MSEKYCVTLSQETDFSKNKKQKYYAIKEGKGVKNKIVRTWSECKELVLGYPSIYKSFYTEEDLQQKQ